MTYDDGSKLKLERESMSISPCCDEPYECEPERGFGAKVFGIGIASSEV